MRFGRGAGIRTLMTKGRRILSPLSKCPYRHLLRASGKFWQELPRNADLQRADTSTRTQCHTLHILPDKMPENTEQVIGMYQALVILRPHMPRMSHCLWHPAYINQAPDAKLILPNIYADLKPRCESTYAEGHLSNTCVLSRRVNVWRHRVGALRRVHALASAEALSDGGCQTCREQKSANLWDPMWRFVLLHWEWSRD